MNEEIILNVESYNPYVIGAVAYVEQLENGAKITIVDKNGTTTATVEDGKDGKSISSIVLNDNYTLTINYEDGSSTTTGSIRGATGASGVFYGEEEPIDPAINVWVDPADGDGSVLKIRDEDDQWATIESIVGEPAGFGTVTATVDANHGTPAVTVTTSGDDTAKNFAFAFSNLQPAPYDDSELQADFATLQGQFDTAVAAVTTDTEVTDIRVGADGITDTTAGASVRRQFTDLKSEISDIEGDIYSSELARHYDSSIPYDGNINLCSGTESVYLIPTPIKKGWIELYSYKPNNSAYKAFVLDKEYKVKKIVDCYTAITKKIVIDEDGYIAIGGDGWYLAYFKISDVGDTTYENVQYRVRPTGGSLNVSVGDVLAPWTEIGQKGAYLVNITQHETFFDSSQPTIVTVGTGKDYTDLKQAVEYANTLDGEVIVEVYEGTYNVYANITAEEIADASYTGDASHFVGLKITDGMTLRGIGDKNSIIINGELSDSVAQSARNAISTLNLIGNCAVENVTVKGTGIRYPVHDDYSDCVNATHTLKNCIFHSVSGPYGSIPHAYGLGTRSGMNVYFDNCEFFPSMVYHTNNGFTIPSVVKFDNCTIDGFIELNDYVSPVKNKAIVIDSTCASIKYLASGATTQGIEVLVRGRSIPIINTTSYEVLYDTSDTLKGRAYDDLTKGNPVRIRENYQMQVFYADTNPALCEGVVLKSVAYRGVALIQCHGWIETSFFPSLTLAVGDKIGVVNGAFAIVQSDEIGIVKRDGLVWLY